MTISAKFKQTIDDHDLITQGDDLLIALSGGPDSVALLHQLCRLRRTHKLRLHALYINHQIRPRAAKKEEKFCRSLCEQLKVDCHVRSADIPSLAKERGKGIEETAREIRYQLLHDLAKELNCNHIALGHHADDRVETILFRLIRGSGRKGLSGMPISRGKIIRPLFHVTRAEILDYLKQQCLSFCIDKSNNEIQYKRNFIRNSLLPLIRKELNPQVDSAILGMSDLLESEEEVLDKIARSKAKSVIQVTPGGKIQLVLNGFHGYDKWLRRRILRLCYQLISTSGLAPDKQIIERLDALAAGSGRGFSLPDKLRVVRLDQSILFCRTERQLFARKIEIGKRCRLLWPDFTFYTKLATVSEPSEIKYSTERRSNLVALDADRLVLPLELRNIKAGDRFRPLGAPGEKKVGNYLTDKKLPPVLRDEQPVLCDQTGIVWLVGYEIADRVKITDNTRRTVTVERHIRKSAAKAAF